PDEAQRLADRVRPGGARRYGGEIGTLETELDGNLASGHVDDHHRDEEWAHPAGTLLEERRVLLLERLHASDARADDDAASVAIDGFEIQSRRPDGLVGGHDRVLDEAIHPLRLLAVHDSLGREALDLAGEASLERGGIEPRDRAGPGLALQQVIPEFLQGVPDGRDHARPGDPHLPTVG